MTTLKSSPRLPACPSCDRRKLLLVERTRRPRSGEHHARCTCGADVKLGLAADGSGYYVAAFRPNRPFVVKLVRPEDDA